MNLLDLLLKYIKSLFLKDIFIKYTNNLCELFSLERAFKKVKHTSETVTEIKVKSKSKQAVKV